MDADDERQSVPFKITRAAIDAAELRAGLEGIGERCEIVISLIVKPDEEAPEGLCPDGAITSLSTLSPERHRQVLMETTQLFAAQTNYPLEMLVLGKGPQQG
jgi:hypothetical protein